MPVSRARPEGPIEFPLHVAAIDVGSNAIRFIAAEFSEPTVYRTLESERVPVRLGHTAFMTRYLEPGLIDRAAEAIAGFRRRMDAMGIAPYRAVATSAVRESQNGREMVERVWDNAEIRIEPITGTEEGRLVWGAIRSRIPLEGRRWILADLGGGSVEVSLADSEELIWTESLPLGTVRLLEELGYDPDAPTGPLRRLLEEYTAALRAPVREAGEVQAMIATGGNAEALADLAGAPADAQGVRRMSRDDLHAIVERLAALTFRERIDTLGLREDRADVILPAAIVYDRLAALSRTDTILVPGVGLKEGVLLDLVEDLVSHQSYEERHTRVVEEGALAVGRRYDFDEPHARHVTRLALQLFDELQSLHELGEEDRRILRAAGLLHDIGQHISYQGHHKHSRYLILNSEPRGLSPREIELVALVARYHRRAEPKASHEGYESLKSGERRRVDRLSALLRLADALDREHEQQVEEMQMDLDDDRLTLRLRGHGDMLLEQWSVSKKGRLFEKVFERRLRVTYRPIE